MVSSVGGVGVNNPERVKSGAEARITGGDVEGENVVHPLEPGEHCVIGKKRHMNVCCHSWLPNRGKKGLKTIKGRKVSLVDRRVLKENY